MSIKCANAKKLIKLLNNSCTINDNSYDVIMNELVFNSNLFKHLDDVAKSNHSIATRALCDENIPFIGYTLMNDKQFISFNIKSHALLMLYANKDLRLNRTFVLSLIRDNPDVIHYIDDSLRNTSFYWSAFKANKKSARWLMHSSRANLIVFAVFAILYSCMIVSLFSIFILHS